MAVLGPADVEAILAQDRETRNLEVKGPGPRTEAHLIGRVTRAAMAMGNLRDGGQIVIGIDNNTLATMQPGLHPNQLASWLSYDDLAQKMAEYSEPPVRFDSHSEQLTSGANVVILDVHEFDYSPHVCKRQLDSPGGGAPILRRGGLYVRSRRMPQSIEVSTELEMREVLDLGMEKRLRAYVTSASRGGVTPRPSCYSEPPARRRSRSAG